MLNRKYLVLGARGLVGNAVLSALERAGETVLAVSRNKPDFVTSAQFVELNLVDRAECKRIFSKPEFADVTHIIYTALYETDDLVGGWQDSDQIRINTEMLRNVLDFVEPLAHLSLLQGTKAYGAHVAPMVLPGKETAPRHNSENFYWTQEDLVRERSEAKGWQFSIFRPQVVFGKAVGSPMNIIAAIGVYAAISRELGEPLCFPGGGAVLTEATDANLLADAIYWAGCEPSCAGKTLNITNGDVLEWHGVWPAIAEEFNMSVGDPEPRRLSEYMPQFAGMWQKVVQKHDLRPFTMDELIGKSWQAADAAFGFGIASATTLLSTIRIRQLGFSSCIDTETMLRHQLRQLQAEQVFPR